MANVKQSYTGNGSQTLFTFSFPYLEEAHVKVSIDGVVTTSWTFANSNTVSFNAAPSVGTAILIYRQTEDTAVAAVLSPGSPIPADPLNENFTQNLYLVQESNDQAAVASTEAASASATAASATASAATAVATAAGAAADAAAAVSTANTSAAVAQAANTTANSANAAAASATTTANNATIAAQTAAADAASAVATASASNLTAQGAQTTATSAVNTATAANTTALAAQSTAQNASGVATNAIGLATTADTNASAAVVTANSAASQASTAQTQSAAAVTTANAAQTAASSAQSNASAAVTTANAADALATSAAAQAASAVTTANTASTNASNAVTTANAASATATQALIDATNADANSQVALTNAYAAIAAVANAVAYAPVADLTALGALTGMANDDPFELIDSTGVESSSLVTGIPVGFVGDPGLAVRLLYKTATSKFEFQNYFATDPENRYAEIAVEADVVTAQNTANSAVSAAAVADGKAVTAQNTANQAVSDAAAAQSTANTAVSAAAAAQSTANAALPKAGGTMTGNITFNGAQTFPVGGIQDATTAQKGVVQLENSTSSTSTTKAAVSAAVKSAYDQGSQGITDAAAASSAASAAQGTANTALANAATAQSTANSASSAAAAAQSTANTANSTANTALSTANAAMPKSGGTFTGSIDLVSGSVSSPSFRFSSSTNSGAYLDSDGSSFAITSGGIQRAKFGGNIDLFINQNNAQAVRIYGYWSGSGGTDLQHWLVPGLRDWKLAVGGAGNWVITDVTSGLATFRVNNTTANGAIGTFRQRRADLIDGQIARVVGKYNGSSSTLVFSRNVTGVTKAATGDYIIYPAFPMGDPNVSGPNDYTVMLTSRVNSSNRHYLGTTLNVEQTDTQIRINNSDNNGTIVDSNMVHFAIFDD